jgi:uncharacterized membrane protein
MLVVFPLGLLVMAVIFDLIDLAGGSSGFGTAAFFNIGAGLVGGALAASTGWIDWTGIPANTRAKRIGLLHAVVNATALVVFVAVWFYRSGVADHRIGGGLLVVELIAVGIAGVAAWFGGELVDRLGIGVHEQAPPDAPNSLTGRPGHSGQQDQPALRRAPRP